MNLKIYTVHHFMPEWYLNNDVFRPFIVGYEEPTIIPSLKPFTHYLRDDYLPTDFQQHSFAEMRAHYWIYRANKLKDYVGFFHYRRRLISADTHAIKLFCSINDYKTAYNQNYELARWKQCDEFDIIVPRRWPVYIDLGEDYCQSHKAINWWTMLAELPDGYSAEGIDYLYPCNIFIMRADLFAEYMAWWETIMLQLVKIIIPPPPPDYQSRTFGFISDRMFTIWLKRKRELMPGLRVLELPMLIGDFTRI